MTDRPATAGSSAAGQRRRAVRTVRMPQMEDADCGAACLAIVLARHGRRVPLREVRERCGIGRDGVTGIALKRVAESYGLRMTARRIHVARGLDGRVDLSGVASLAVPAMIFVDQRHFAVLEGVRRRTVRVNDPAVGRIGMTGEEFLDRFSGISLLFEPSAEFSRGGTRLIFPRAAMARLRPYLRWLAAAVTAGILRALPIVVISLLIRAFLTYAIGLGDAAWRVPIVTGLALIAVFAIAGAVAQQRILAGVVAAMATKGGSDYMWRLLRLPGAFFHRRHVGGMVTRVQFNDGIAILLSERLTLAVADALTVLMYLGVLAWIDPLAAGLAAGLVAVNALAMRTLARATAPEQQRLLFDEYRRDSLAFNGLAMIETLKADGAENWFFARWAGLQARALCTMQRLARTSQLLLVIPAVMGTLAGALILVACGVQVLHGQVTVPTLLAAQMLASAVLLPANALVGVGGDAQIAKAQLSMLDDALSADIDPYLTPVLGAGPESSARLEGRLELVDVTFGYDPSQPPVIEGLTLTVEPGQRVAIVGTTGSGKSTIARLVTGVLRPWSGAVRLDGIERDAQPRGLVSTSLAYVEQQLRLFEGSVGDNLTLWDPTVPADRVQRALHDACVERVVTQRGGLDAGWIQEQARNLSGGEKQRIEIARALTLDPSIIVLDEATSALDAETEMLIDANIRARGVTCLVIAHRLSTIRDSDLIVVLDRGHVVQQGCHDELIAAAGAYRTLVKEAA
ncbi:MAG TPA: ATP-binding cassette domain-containing protein [Streptosporangiaceae bacterium]